MEIGVVLDHVEALEEWAEVDPQEETCSKELETGSVQTRDAETRTLPGEWSVTSVRLPSPKVLEEALLSLLVVREAEEAWACAEAAVWIVVALLEDQEAQGSVEAGAVTVEDSEEGEEWIEEVSGAVAVHPWIEWAVVEAEEWVHLEARWI